MAASPAAAPYTLSGCCISYGHALTYRALGDVLCELLGGRESDSPDQIIERLGSRRILGLTLELDVAGDLHPLAALERLRIAWRDVLGELVADRPAVVLVEDLHWAQPDLLDLLEYLTDGVDGPLLLVSTTRPEPLMTGSTPSTVNPRSGPDQQGDLLQPLLASATPAITLPHRADLHSRRTRLC